MPQASDELREEFQDGGPDYEPLGGTWRKYLDKDFIDDRGVIRLKDKNYKPTDKQFRAIDYLCDEWDYAWEGL